MFLIFLNGYISLSLELVVLRQLSFYVGSSAVITSIIMGVFLGFMSCGYFVGGSPRIKNDKIRPILGAGFLLVTIITMLAASFPLISSYFAMMWASGVTSSIVQTFIFSGALLSVGPFLFGFNTTLLSRLLQTGKASHTGAIMAWDTIGSVLASMATTLVLMPFIGVNYTVVSICALGMMAALISYPRVVVGVVGMAVFGVTLWLNSDAMLRQKYGVLVNNANSTMMVYNTSDGRMLYMNGLPMSIYNPETGRGAEYINYVNDNFIATMPRDRRRNVLVLGAGGFTAGLNDDFNEYTFVDIEHTLRDVAEKYFLGQKLGENKKFIVQDASQFLKNTATQYDLILLDVYSNAFQIPEGFITAEFMTRLKSRVAPGGILLMNVIARPNFSDAFSRVFDNTFHTVFTSNTSRQVVGHMSPWGNSDVANIIYEWYNTDNDGRVYTINRTPVIYDRL